MTPQERIDREAVEAIAQLIEVCHGKNGTQIAALEISLTIHGLGRLAGMVRQQGLINAGDEYMAEFEQAAQDRFGR